MEKNFKREELFEKLDQLEEYLGTKEVLKELALALSSKELQENLEFIDRMHGTEIFED